MYYYNRQTQGFLVEGLHQIPESAVKISEELHRTLIEGQSQGKQIVTGLDGVPMLAEAQPSQYHHWDGSAWIIDTEQQAALLAEQRELVRSKINALRDAKSAGGVYVEQLGKWFDSDSKAQGKLLGLKATMDLVGSEMTVDWTCADNTDFKGFSKPQLTAVMAAILQTENHNHTVARQHKASLEQSDNPLDYDYSGGWATCYHDYLSEQGNE